MATKGSQAASVSGDVDRALSFRGIPRPVRDHPDMGSGPADATKMHTNWAPWALPALAYALPFSRA